MHPLQSKYDAFCSSRRFITWMVAYAVFVDSFVYGAIVPVIPFSLRQEGVTKDEDIQDLIMGLLGIFGFFCFIASVPMGLWADRHSSRKGPFLYGLISLLVATALLWAALYLPHIPSILIQVCARAFQGLSSAMVWTIALAMLVDTVGPENVGRHAGYIGIALNFGNVLGPGLAGPVHEHGGYHAVMGLVVGSIVLDILFRLMMKENPKNKPLVLTASSWNDLESMQKNDPSAELKSQSSFSSTTSSGYGHAEVSSPPTKCRSPTLRLLYSRRFCVNLWGIVALAMVFTSFETVLPVTVKKEFGWSSMGAGLIFLPFSLPSLLGPLFGKATDRFGGRWFIFASFMILCPVLLVLRFVEKNEAADITLLIVLLLIAGTCLAAILEPLFADIARRSNELEQEDKLAGRDTGHGYYAQAYAHFNMAWSIGNTAGPVMAGLINNAAGWKAVTLAMGIVAGISAIPLVLYSDGCLFSELKQRQVVKKAANAQTS